MPNPHGSFIWYELLTSDLSAARDFYQRVVGWKIEAEASNPMDYRMIETAHGMVAGAMQINDEMREGGARPVWLGYIGVDDVDAQVDAITAAGGKVLMPAMDLPDVGRIAFVADPDGAPFYVMKPAPPAGNPDATSNAFAADAPLDGHCAWNELAAVDQAGAVAFYTSQFGWRQDGDMDMGPMGKYQFFWHGPGMIGAVMPKVPQMPVPLWTYYFRVPDIDAAVEAIRANGGTIFQDPIEIPGGDYALNGMDPQGAMFALVGARK